MKLSIADRTPKVKEKTYEFSLVENSSTVDVKVSVNGSTPVTLMSFKINPYENEKVHMERSLVSKEDFSTDGHGQIAYNTTSELNKY
jgi:hypothetical protein